MYSRAPGALTRQRHRSTPTRLREPPTIAPPVEVARQRPRCSSGIPAHGHPPLNSRRHFRPRPASFSKPMLLRVAISLSVVPRRSPLAPHPMYTGSYYFQLAAGVSRTSGALARRRHRSRPTRPPHPSKRLGGDLRADLASQSTAIIRLGGHRHPMAARCVAHRPTRRSAGGLLSMGCWPSPRPLAQAHIDVGEDGRWRPRGEASKRGARQAQSEEAKRQSPEERSRHLFGPNLNKVIGNQPCFPKELRGRFKHSTVTPDRRRPAGPMG